MKLIIPYKDYYKQLTKDIKDDPFLIDMAKKYAEELSTWGFNAEIMSEKLSDFYLAQTQIILQQTQNTTLALLKAELELDTIKRKTQGYDDNILIKLVEAQSGVASFAVNSGSDDAQTAITKLLALMCICEKRVTKIDSGNSETATCSI